MKHLPRFLLVLLLCCASLAAVRAEADLPEAGPAESSWTLTTAVTSHYMFRGVQLAKASFQPALDFAAGPWSAGAWASTALQDGESGDADPEVDLYGAFTWALSDTGIELVPGVQLYTYPDAKRSEGYYTATFEPSLAANVIVSGIRITPKCYYDFTLKGATFECTAAVALPLTALGTELGLSASIGTFRWDDVSPVGDARVKNWGDYWSIGASVPYQVSANGQIAFGVSYAKGRKNFIKEGTDPKTANDAAVGRTAVILSYSLSL